MVMKVDSLPEFGALKDHDIVIIPSMTLAFYESRGLTSVHEERHLLLLDLMRNTNCRVIFVISTALDNEIIKYRLEILSRAMNITDLADRLILLEAKDDSNRALTEKILDNEDLIKEIKSNIRNPEKTLMLNYICSTLDETLRNKLGIKRWFGSIPSNWGTKSGSRTIFSESGIPLAEGTLKPVYSVDKVLSDLIDLKKKTKTRRIILKIDDGAGGYGNAILDFSSIDADKEISKAAVERVLRKAIAAYMPTWEGFIEQLEQTGCIVEQMIDPEEGMKDFQTQPSVQLYISDSNKVKVLSSHEQVIDTNYYMGCRYPADQDYLDRVLEYGRKVGECLAKKGVRGFCGVDFLATRKSNGMWDIIAIEINLRIVATMYTYFMLRSLVSEEDMKNKHYINIDEIILKDKVKNSVTGFRDLQKDLVDYGLDFDWKKGTGVIFTTLSYISKQAEAGVMFVANSKKEVDELHMKFMQTMASEKQHCHAYKESSQIEDVESVMTIEKDVDVAFLRKSLEWAPAVEASC